MHFSEILFDHVDRIGIHSSKKNSVYFSLIGTRVYVLINLNASILINKITIMLIILDCIFIFLNK